MTPASEPSDTRPDPNRVVDAASLGDELGLLRLRAARQAGRATVSLDRLARTTGIPRSTVHAYLAGRRLPPPDSLDAIAGALGADRQELDAWSDALVRALAARTATAPAPPAPAPDGATVPRQLPAAPAVLVGRRDAVHDIVDALTAPTDHPAVVVVTGTGGVGKTAAVLRAAHDVADRFPDGQVWVDLRGFGPGAILEPIDALERLLRAVGSVTLTLPADLDDRAALFRSAVAGRRMVIVLDNARHAAQVIPLLAGTPSVATVVTSRDAMRALTARHGGRRISLGRLDDTDARTLLRGTVPEGAARDSVATIVGHCDGLPLALRIVGERLESATPDEIEEFARSLDDDTTSSLEAFDLNDGSCEVSVHGVLTWSYEALAPEVARLFRLLPLCLVSTVDIESVAVVADLPLTTARRLLDSLVNANLLDAVAPGLFRIHDLVLFFAAERLTRDEPEAEIRAGRSRLLDHLCDCAESVIPLWDPDVPIRLPRPGRTEVSTRFADDRTAFAWVLDHVDQLVVAVTQAAADGDPRSWMLGERATRALWPCTDIGILVEPLAAARAAAVAVGATDAAVIMSRVLGVLWGRRGQLAECEQACLAAVEAAAADPTAVPPEFSTVDLANLGAVSALQGKIDAAERRLAEVMQQPGGHATVALLTWAMLDLDRGDVGAAREHLDAARRALDLLPRTVVAFELSVLEARFSLVRGRPTDALTQLADIEGRDRRGLPGDLLSQALTHRAGALRATGDPVGARHAADDALRTARESGVRVEELDAWCLLAELSLAEADIPAAEDAARQVLVIARQCGIRHSEVRALVILAECHESPDLAATIAADAEALALASDYRPLAERAAAVRRSTRPLAG